MPEVLREAVGAKRGVGRSVGSEARYISRNPAAVFAADQHISGIVERDCIRIPTWQRELRRQAAVSVVGVQGQPVKASDVLISRGEGRCEARGAVALAASEPSYVIAAGVGVLRERVPAPDEVPADGSKFGS